MNFSYDIFICIWKNEVYSDYWSSNSDKQKHLYFQGHVGSSMYISVISGPIQLNGKYDSMVKLGVIAFSEYYHLVNFLKGINTIPLKYLIHLH